MCLGEGDGEGGDNPLMSLWAVLGTVIPYLTPVGTHTLRPTDLGLEPALVGCGTLGKLLDFSELSCFPLKSEGSDPPLPMVGVRLRREGLHGITRDPCPSSWCGVGAQ